MNRFPRLILLLLALCLGSTLCSEPGRAQAPSSSRFAFADTTLLRDTLGLDFSRLFKTSDSLSLTPDTLRAWMIRYRFSIPRMLAMADSMAMPVDSVGPVLNRERFNPLASGAGGEPINRLLYNSTYDIRQTMTVWTNSSDWNMQRGQVFVRNSTSIELDRTTRSGRTSTQQRRSSLTESGWKFSENFSAGGRANLERYNAFDPGATNNEGETKNEFELSARTRQKPSRSVTTEMNLFSGVLDLRNVSQLKRGFKGDLNGRVRLVSSWFTQDLSGQVNGNLARTRLPGSVGDQSTSDLSTRLLGTLTLLQSSPVGLNLNLQLQRSRVESPAARDSIVRNLTNNNSVDATLRLRRDDERYMTLVGRWGSTRLNIGNSDNVSGTATLRWPLLGWGADANWREGGGRSQYPRRASSFGYNDEPSSRGADITLQRALGRFNTKLSGNISLDRNRYVATADSVNLPIDKDNYRQSYRAETIFTRDDRLSTTLALQVSLSTAVNIPAVASSSTNDTRSYQGEWRWNYRLFRGLTVTQSNVIQADYHLYTFTPERNDLGLNYNTNTSLQAALTPRLQLEVQHNTRQQPRGSYIPVRGSGLSFLPADDSRDYTLRAPVTWSPSPSLSLNVVPNYSANDRNGTVNGSETPTRRSRTLELSGGANLNLQVGGKGRVTGRISRTYRADRSTTFNAGVPTPQPRSEQDYWNGQLVFSWNP